MTTKEKAHQVFSSDSLTIAEARLVAFLAEERERCAKMLEDKATEQARCGCSDGVSEARICAQLIREMN